MAKLPPPLIEGTIPAFYSNRDGTAATLAVPFSMNRAVSSQEVNGFIVRLKTIQSNNYLFTSTYTRENTNEKIEDSPIVHFELNEANIDKLKSGQFYKCQIAYINNGEIGYYSSVGIVKFTNEPKVYIDDLETGIINMHQYNYRGTYSQRETQSNGVEIVKDFTERVDTYNFKVWDSKENLIFDTGELLHDHSTDEELFTSSDEFFLAKEFELNESYYIQYTVTTNNKLTVSSPRYRIMQKTSLDPEIEATLKASLNFDNGYIDIDLVGKKDEDGMETPITGGFLLSRSSEDSNYTIWDEISRFKLAGQIPSRWLWRDYTVEQGKYYKYSLQQYNDAGLYSNRMLSNEIFADFEDAFLFDGEKQLKIRFNPKMSSFKPNVLETKTNTIGSKHPYIFRNGQVYYREFPISGLISYQMDEEKLFMDVGLLNNLTRAEAKKLNYTIKENEMSLQIARERKFKMAVLEWLTDGKTKIFRSPTEGNFIVRLMNVSLSPNDQLGRMIHSFSATAYEVADYNYESLNSYDFIKLENPEVKSLRWETVKFFSTDQKTGDVTYKEGVINTHTAYTVKVSDLMPGDYIYISTDTKKRFKNMTEAQKEKYKVVIGATGSYYIDSPVEIQEIVLPTNAKYTGSVTYSYYSVLQNTFNKISTVSVEEIPVRQFVGAHDVIKEITHIKNASGKWIKNPKVEIVKFYNLQASKRFINRSTTDTISTLTHDLYAIGEYVKDKDKPEYRPGYPKEEFNTIYYKDPYNNIPTIYPTYYDPSIYINNEQVSLNETETYSWIDPGNFESLKVGNGVFLEVSYQIRIIDFLIEDNKLYSVWGKKQSYLKAKQDLDSYIATLKKEDAVYPNQSLTIDQINNLNALRVGVDNAYINYINTLVIEQEKERVADGLL